jgi:hypothetical protein
MVANRWLRSGDTTSANNFLGFFTGKINKNVTLIDNFKKDTKSGL